MNKLFTMHNKKFYGLFLAQAILLASAVGFSSTQAQNDTTLTSQLTNLTNATRHPPEQIKQMDILGGTVNGTLNATNTSSAGGSNATN
ncbi:MAG: hypothetical protein WCE25_06830 [Nitrososphaeraceae archaeon]